MTMSLEQIEAALQRLLDIEAIKQVKARYCYAVDAGDQEAVVNLFVEEATADYGVFGKADNRREVAEFFRTIDQKLPFMLHMVHNPIIEVDGDTARGVWYFDVPATSSATQDAIWIQGRYDDGFVRVNGEWKISRMDCSFNYMTPFDKGWVKQRMFTASPASVSGGEKA